MRDQSILLLGHHGGQNTGDDAMLVSLLDSLPRFAKVSVAAKAGLDLQHVTNREVSVVALRIASTFKAIIASDILVLAGGTHFHDDYRSARLLRHYLYLLRFIAIFFVGKVLGKRIYLIGIGVGPITHAITRVLTEIAVALSDGVSVRDCASFKELSNLRSNAKITEAFDLTALKFGQSDVTASQVNGACLAISVTDVPGVEGAVMARQKVVQLVSESLAALLASNPLVSLKILVMRGAYEKVM